MSTKTQRQRKLLKEIWVDGVGSTGDRKTDANLMQNDLYAWKLSNGVAAARWLRMRGDVVKT